MNDFQTFLRTRRSIRRFKSRLVPASVIKRILETATNAPSAHNLQPWRFAIVQSDEAKANLGQALTDKLRFDMTAEGQPQVDIDKRVKISLHRIDEAPVIILLCRDVTAVRKDEPEEHTLASQSVAAAGLQLLLAAHAEGLGSNWICWPLYAQDVVRAAFNLSNTWEPQAMVFIGYADEKPREKTIRPLKEILVVE